MARNTWLAAQGIGSVDSSAFRCYRDAVFDSYIRVSRLGGRNPTSERFISVEEQRRLIQEAAKRRRRA